MNNFMLSISLAICSPLIFCNRCMSEDTPETRKLCRKLARHYESCLEDRQRLFSITDKTSQLGAYWLLLTAEGNPTGRYRKGEYNREKFIGFLEAQGVHLPEWWVTDTLQDEGASIEPSFWELSKYLNKNYELYKAGKAADRYFGNVPLLPEMQLVNSGKELSITMNGEKRGIRDLDSIPQEYSYVPYLHLGRTQTYLLLRSLVGDLQDMELFAYDLSGRFVWKQNFTKQPVRGWAGKSPPTRVQIIEQGNNLFVYRSDINGAGFECLDSQSGETKFLFLTGLASGAIELINERKSAAELLVAKERYQKADPLSVKLGIKMFELIMNKYPNTEAGAEAEYILLNYEKLSPNEKYVELEELLK